MLIWVYSQNIRKKEKKNSHDGNTCDPITPALKKLKQEE
jgi:hypothetical protein